VGAYAVSAVCFVLAAGLARGVRHEQETRKLTLGRVPRDLAEGLAYAWGDPTVRAVLLVTVVMNMFAFSYAALVAPLALGVFKVSQAVSGLMSSAEAVGSWLGGIVLAAVTPKHTVSGRLATKLASCWRPPQALGIAAAPRRREGREATLRVTRGCRWDGAGLLSTLCLASTIPLMKETRQVRYVFRAACMERAGEGPRCDPTASR
jgi:hypothetical protein